jgi:hypothetical protein
MGLHDPFGHLKHKLWRKERSFDSWPLKVKTLPDFFACKWCATYHWKALGEGYNFSLELISIRGLHTKLWASKITNVPISRISRLKFMSLGTKWHLGVRPVARHKKYYKGESGGFPQVRTVVNLVSPCLPMVNACTKSVRTMQ